MNVERIEAGLGDMEVHVADASMLYTWNMNV